jgi:hypothetical protein
MRTLLTGFAVGMLSLAGTAALLALTRLVLVQVRGLTRLTRQLSDHDDQPGLPWEFSDCASPPGWLLPPARQHGRPGAVAAVRAPASSRAAARLELTEWGARS